MRDANSYAHQHGDGDRLGHCHGDCHHHGNGHRDVHTHTDRHGDRNFHRNGYAHGNADENTSAGRRELHIADRMLVRLLCRRCLL
jgi:hypothetical protein